MPSSSISQFKQPGQKGRLPTKLSFLQKLEWGDDYIKNVFYLEVNNQTTSHMPRVPNLSLTMYPFSIPTDEHVSLQHFNR